MRETKDPPYLAYNDSGETIPSYAAVEVTGEADDIGAMRAVKPIGNNADRVFFNGPVSVPDGERFAVYPALPTVLAAIHEDDYPFTENNSLGVVAGSWHLRTSGRGFTLMALPTLGVAQVQIQLDYTGAVEIVRCGTSLGGSPAKWEGFIRTPTSLTASTEATTRVILAPLQSDTVLVPGRLYIAIERGLHSGEPLYWTGVDPECDLVFQAVTDASISGCVITLTKTTYKLVCDGAAEVVSTTTSTIAIPSTCKEVLTNVTATTACVGNVPTITLTKTFETVRVLNCGACT
jgi:hypothetical protein